MWSLFFWSRSESITSPHRRRTCQAAYTISKDVRHSLTSLIGTARREGRFGTSPPHQPISLVLSRHGRTDVMAMKDALGGWSGGGPMHAQRSTVDTCVLGGHTTVPAHQRRQPPRSHPNDASPTLLLGPHCRTPVAGPSPITAEVRYTLYTNGAVLSAVRFLLIHYRKPTWISTTVPGRRRHRLFL